jgi:dihydroorotase
MGEPMPTPADRPLYLRHARLIDPETGRDEMGDCLIEDGVISALGPDVAVDRLPPRTEIVECGGRVLAPGLIDMRVFIGEPGFEHRETIKSAGGAAAAGGVTTIMMMPDTDPVIDEPALVDFILRRARDASPVRVLPMAALTKGLRGDEMTEIGLLKWNGACAFTSGRQSVTNALVMRRTLTYARDFDALVVHHVEDPNLVGEGVMNEGERAARLGLTGIPSAVETIPLERDMRLVALTGARYHAALVSCAESLDVIRAAKAKGLPVTCGVSIANLTLNENDIGDYRTFFKMAPPLRSEDDRMACVEGLRDGTIDVIVSNHDPQHVETKRYPFAEAENGAIGLETLLPAALRLMHAGHVDLVTVLRALTCAPAALLGLPQGRLQVGAPGDVILIDLEEPWVLEEDMIRSRSKNTPFERARFQGRVNSTVVAGRVVYT